MKLRNPEKNTEKSNYYSVNEINLCHFNSLFTEELINYSIFCSELLNSDVMVIYTSKNTIISNKQETHDISRI